MKIAPLPVNEDQRIADLESYDILDTAAESDFDGLVELASQICKCPISLISLLDKDRQWFKARKGLDEESTSREISFCSHVIAGDDVFVVDDATKDERFVDNPLVTGSPGVRFYAGAPIISPAGNKLGAICIIDNKPRTLSAEEERALVLLSNQVTKLLEIRKKNSLIRSRAREIITLKSRAINKVMEDHERDKKAIATDLHEDLAQSIASSMMYLNMAQMDEEERLSHLQTAKEQLNDTLSRVRKLSYRITPLSTNWLNATGTITEFIDRTRTTYPFIVRVEGLGENEGARADSTLATVRIIEQWLKVLVDQKDISFVQISILSDDHFYVVIEDDSYTALQEEREQQLVDTAITDKIEAYGGEVSLTITPGSSLLKIKLPLISKISYDRGGALMPIAV